MLTLVQTIIVVLVSFIATFTIITLIVIAFIIIKNKRREAEFKFYLQNNDYREYETIKNKWKDN